MEYLISCEPLEGGELAVVDKWGSDQKIVDCARVSYDRGEREQKRSTEVFLKQLYELGHHTPFEQCGLTFKVKTPIFVWRQWIRHRLASVNEVSERYSESDLDFYEPVEWRVPKDTPDDVRREICQRQRAIHQNLKDFYRYLRDHKVPRELARIDLPLSKFTTAYWTANLREVFHFLKLRLDPAAQLEIRKYAEGMLYQVQYFYPLAVKAFFSAEGELAKRYLTTIDFEALPPELRGNHDS